MLYNIDQLVTSDFKPPNILKVKRSHTGYTIYVNGEFYVSKVSKNAFDYWFKKALQTTYL